MKTEIKWAVINTVAVFFMFLVEKLLGWHTAEGISNWLTGDLIGSLLIFIFTYYMVTKEKRDVKLGGIMTWRQGFSTAAIMSLIFIPLSSIMIYIFIQYISPDLPAFFAQESGTAIFGKDPVSNFMFGHLLSAVFGGLLFSLIFPLLTRRST